MPVDLAPLSTRQLLLRVLERLDSHHATVTERLQTMSQIATDTASAVAAENTKIETLLSLVGPALAGLQAQLAAAQAQVAALTAGDAADAVTLQGTLDAAVAETAKVQAAIDALTPPAPTAG